MTVGIDERNVHGYEVRALEQIPQCDEFHVEELRALNRHDRVVRHDLHLQPMRALGDL